MSAERTICELLSPAGPRWSLPARPASTTPKSLVAFEAISMRDYPQARQTVTVGGGSEAVLREGT